MLALYVWDLCEDQTGNSYFRKRVVVHQARSLVKADAGMLHCGFSRLLVYVKWGTVNSGQWTATSGVVKQCRPWVWFSAGVCPWPWPLTCILWSLLKARWSCVWRLIYRQVLSVWTCLAVQLSQQLLSLHRTTASTTWYIMKWKNWALTCTLCSRHCHTFCHCHVTVVTRVCVYIT